MNDRDAKTAVAEFQKAFKAASSMAEKNRALDVLAEGCNKLLVKPLGQVADTDKLIVIRKRAVELLAIERVTALGYIVLRIVGDEVNQ